MIDSLPIDAVVKQTGLTSRTLRFYEARGLLQPLRTARGRRLFGAADLERIHQIVALKKAGLSLTQIARVIHRKPVDLEALIDGQLAALEEQARTLANARSRLSTLLSRIKTGEPLDVDTLCDLIRQTECMPEDAQWKAVIDRYYTPEEQAEWRATVQPRLSGIYSAEYNGRWRDLSQRIEAALPLAPDSEAALGFVREWFHLLEPFSRVATPEMWEQSRDLYSKQPEWEGDVDTVFSSRVWFFVREATELARAAGKDIGPVPAWMQTPSSPTEH